MDFNKIKQFIVNKGFRTLSELRSEFDNEEILIINLNYLIEKKSVKKIKFQAPQGPEELYYLSL